MAIGNQKTGTKEHEEKIATTLVWAIFFVCTWA
jgi:hypothetical protein